MFRSGSSLEGSTPIDNMSSFHDLGGLNMYLDTASHNISPPVSSATLSPPTTPLTPEPTMSSTQFPLLTDGNHVNMNASTAASTLLMQRQYQYHLLLQQQQQQLAFAQHQLALAASAAAANHHQEDEIAHSLKMFALLTACNADTGSGSTQDAMQEFAANGYSSQLPSQVPISSAGTGGNATAEGATFPSSLAAAHWINLSNYREHLNHVWRTMSMSYMPNVAANMGFAMPASSQNNINTMGLAVPPDHMRNVSNLNISNNKLNKRYNNGKFKELVPRHCVFCENNNEPEAVVNSHTVRDAYGRVLCPKLRTYVCPICGASGDSAHTIKYCPKKPIVTMEDAIKAESFRLAKSNYYKQQMKV
ncbi:protein nanos isoform X2 [Drosophila novamexicana]|uniref:protein nanos isoform X2 n=1 Tax=Drosophila novamexicana TaxID=47314 RepID=UPI0011E5E24C|nr:protein nanos isoform X2 [Drosophila novamexicana]